MKTVVFPVRLCVDVRIVTSVTRGQKKGIGDDAQRTTLESKSRAPKVRCRLICVMSGPQVSSPALTCSLNVHHDTGPSWPERRGGERGVAQTPTSALNRGFLTGNTAGDIQLGGKRQYLHRHIDANDVAFYTISHVRCRCSNAHRCTSFPPTNRQTGINKRHRQDEMAELFAAKPAL